MIYLKNFMQDKHIAAIAPTSHFGVKKVCSKLDIEHADVIVEYGPATGVFTRYFLQHMNRDAIIITIERNPNFVKIMNEQFDDPRLHVVEESAENVTSIVQEYTNRPVDYIISGIPFTLFSDAMREEIIAGTHHVLREGGKFIPYQTFFQRDAHLKNYMKRYFKHVEDEFGLLNLPPIRIYEGIK